MVSEYTWFQSSYVVLWFRFNCVHVLWLVARTKMVMERTDTMSGEDKDHGGEDEGV